MNKMVKEFVTNIKRMEAVYDRSMNETAKIYKINKQPLVITKYYL